MKTAVKTLLVALTALLATAQRRLEFSYEGAIIDATTRYIQQAGEEYAFRPLMGALQIETAESVGMPAVVRKLEFPLQETVCKRTEDQTGKLCPLKRNGKTFMCNMAISQPVLESSIPQSTDITCEPMTTADQLQGKLRMRRSKSTGGKSSGGGKKGSGGKKGGSRPGGGSSIAGGGKKGGGTQTA